VSEQEPEPLRRLAERIEQAGLRVPASIVLGALSPLDVISSELVRFSLPLVSGSAVEPFAAALTETQAWDALRRLLSVDKP
jgi:hypothetical protein